MNESVVVAITGGIGTGKSAVAAIIKEMGFPVISSDTVAKELMVKDEEIRTKLIKEFSDNIYLPDDMVNKELVSLLVFGDDEKSAQNLAKMNSIVHPKVIEHMINSVEELDKKGEKLIFVESALTFEAGLEDGFDYIVVVDAPEDTCIERVSSRSGLSGQQVRQRMNTQIPQQEKVGSADFVIDNSGTPEKLRQSVEFVMMILKTLEPKSEEEESE